MALAASAKQEILRVGEVRLPKFMTQRSGSKGVARLELHTRCQHKKSSLCEHHEARSRGHLCSWDQVSEVSWPPPASRPFSVM
jgi:hypothetical protein